MKISITWSGYEPELKNETRKGMVKGGACRLMHDVEAFEQSRYHTDQPDTTRYVTTRHDAFGVRIEIRLDMEIRERRSGHQTAVLLLSYI